MPTRSAASSAHARSAFTEAGLTPNEVRAYLALRRLRSASPGRVARGARLTPHGATRALRALARKGLARRGSRSGPFEPLDLVPYLRRQGVAASRLDEIMDLLRAARTSASPMPREPPLLLGVADVSDGIRRCFAAARREVFVAVGPGALRAVFETFVPDIRRARQRGVRVRILTRIGFDMLEAVEELRGAGADVRHAPGDEWPQRAVIVDRTLALLLPLGGTAEDIRSGRTAAVRLNDERVVRAMGVALTRIWTGAQSAERAVQAFRVRGKYGGEHMR